MKKLNEKKITILALHLGTGGVEKYLSSLCKMLEGNYEIEIISTYKLSEKPAFNFSKKIKINYLINEGPCRSELKDAIKKYNVLKVFKYIFKNIKLLFLKYVKNINAIKKIDSKYVITTRIFHNTLVNNFLPNDGYVKIATEHNYPTDKYKQNLVNSISNFNYLVVVSKELETIYSQEKMHNCKCVHIPNVIDSLPNKKSRKEANTIISIGRLVEEKGYSDLIDVVNILKKKNEKIKLYLIGDGNEKANLEEKIRVLRLNDNIKLLGFLPFDKCSSYLSKSKLYVMSSHTESFGLVLIEAMSHKLPCIAFDSASGARELLGNKRGILINDRDKNKMADEISKLLKNSKIYNKYSEVGYEYSKEFLVDNVKKKWLKLIKEK